MIIMPNYFLYVRKSTDTEDKQVRSIDDQLAVLRSLAKEQGLKISEEFVEKWSAKTPGRLIFNEMLKKLQAGKASGIICWKLDRLARNPVDAAQIQWLLQQGTIQHIQTHDRSYYPSDNVMLMNMEFGIANQYIRDLSTNTKRGMYEKAKRGDFPGLAPIGYLNNLRTNTIVIDRKKAAIVKAAFELYVHGNSRLEDISTFFVEQDLLSRNGKPFKRDKITRILSNPIYCGLFQFSGELYQGNHQPIVSKQLFDTVQKVLRDRSRPHKQSTNNPQALCGLFRCGECSRAITAEAKTKIQQNGNTHHYIYYRCTKKNTQCSQPFIRQEDLTQKLSNTLSQFVMPQEWASELSKMAEENSNQAAETTAAFVQGLRSKVTEIDRKLQRLLTAYLDQDIEQEPYRSEKNRLVSEKHSLEEQIARLVQKSNAWLEPLREWLKQAQTLGEIAISPDLTPKKSAAQTCF
jgi:site-specific DNA recombinase